MLIQGKLLCISFDLSNNIFQRMSERTNERKKEKRDRRVIIFDEGNKGEPKRVLIPTLPVVKSARDLDRLSTVIPDKLWTNTKRPTFHMLSDMMLCYTNGESETMP